MGKSKKATDFNGVHTVELIKEILRRNEEEKVDIYTEIMAETIKTVGVAMAKDMEMMGDKQEKHNLPIMKIERKNGSQTQLVLQVRRNPDKFL